MNDFRSVVHPFDRLFRRIVAVDGLSGIISLKKTDTASAAHIDSRYNQHVPETSFPQIVTKFLSMASPQS